MALPALLAFHDDDEVHASLRRQLTRYVADYRVEIFGDPDKALTLLEALAANGDDVALVVAGEALWSAREGTGIELVRELQPQAKRAMLVQPGAWVDPSSADAIRD